MSLRFRLVLLCEVPQPKNTMHICDGKRGNIFERQAGISCTSHRGRSAVARYGDSDVPDVSEGVGFARNERVIPRGAEQVERGVVSVPQGVAQSRAPKPREGVEATRVVSSTRGIH